MIIAALLFFATLQSQIAAIAAQTDATVGVTAIDLDESGQRVSIHGGDHFPMASVFKFPVALVVLQRVDSGEFNIHQEASDAKRRCRAPRGGTNRPRNLRRVREVTHAAEREVKM